MKKEYEKQEAVLFPQDGSEERQARCISCLRIFPVKTLELLKRCPYCGTLLALPE